MFGRADTNTTVGLWPGLLRAVLRSVSAGSPLAASPCGQHACRSVGTPVRTSSRRLVVFSSVAVGGRLCLAVVVVVVVVEQAGGSMCRQPVCTYTAYHVGSARHVLTRSHRMSKAFGQRLVWHTTCSVRTRPSARLSAMVWLCRRRLHRKRRAAANDAARCPMHRRPVAPAPWTSLLAPARSRLQHHQCLPSQSSWPATAPSARPGRLLCTSYSATYIHAPVMRIASASALKPKQLARIILLHPKHTNRHHRPPCCA